MTDVKRDITFLMHAEQSLLRPLQKHPKIQLLGKVMFETVWSTYLSIKNTPSKNAKIWTQMVDWNATSHKNVIERKIKLSNNVLCSIAIHLSRSHCVVYFFSAILWMLSFFTVCCKSVLLHRMCSVAKST